MTFALMTLLGCEYDDIAREYIGITILTRKELIGKNEINVFTIEDENISKYIAYQSIIPLVSSKAITDKLKSTDMYELYKNIELPCTFVLYEMEKRDSHYGLATLCIGGGMGTALIVERV